LSASVFDSHRRFPSQRPPAKQVAWIFGHRPKRQKNTPVILAMNLLSRLGRDAKHAVCMARINGNRGVRLSKLTLTAASSMLVVELASYRNTLRSVFIKNR
jgi:hypothetical protein